MHKYNLPITLVNSKRNIVLYEGQVKKYPHSSAAWYTKGLVLTRLRDYNEAINCFKTSLIKDSKAAGAFKSYIMDVVTNK